uniref:Uncharacterized protein n=1 Tax=Chlamydia pneumoniae TaxID=83558 RepID=A0A0F7YWB8_CHLPN|nr:hypothetical protein BN1224_H12_AF_00010 [Chlamydia pneumoniae]CRI46662.1 hypothetical protein BN1224_Panola_B_00010 [Chlamydia pneumoniae]CRI72703.1 hypothetical protein BN1224_YK41_AD_00010 [Chlamydia pneumoniae]
MSTIPDKRAMIPKTTAVICSTLATLGFLSKKFGFTLMGLSLGPLK